MTGCLLCGGLIGVFLGGLLALLFEFHGHSAQVGGVCALIPMATTLLSLCSILYIHGERLELTAIGLAIYVDELPEPW